MGIDHPATMLEEPIQDPVEQLNHQVPEMGRPAIAPLSPPVVAGDTTALRHSMKTSRLPVRYGNPVVLPNNVEIFE